MSLQNRCLLEEGEINEYPDEKNRHDAPDITHAGTHMTVAIAAEWTASAHSTEKLPTPEDFEWF